MELYMLNRQHGRMILESVKSGPLLWPTVEENGVTRLKKYSELSTTEAIQADCDVKAKYIILEGLPPEERVRLLVGSPGASTTPVYSPGSSSTSIYSPRSLTPPRYSPGASTPQSYSMGTSRNAECSICKHLLDKITVLEATVDMYMHPEQHTVNSAALFHEVYSNMGKLDLE
nr:hypothetical protein [Tanacetum cinerariifolium]